jgi:hypothetical protein
MNAIHFLKIIKSIREGNYNNTNFIVRYFLHAEYLTSMLEYIDKYIIILVGQYYSVIDSFLFVNYVFWCFKFSNAVK